MLRGLPDQSISLELLTKRISSMTEAIHQVVLYETYKRGTRERHNIRQLNTDEPPFVTGNDTEDVASVILLILFVNSSKDILWSGSPLSIYSTLSVPCVAVSMVGKDFRTYISTLDAYSWIVSLDNFFSVWSSCL
jgi:hypothetical protein